VITPDKPLIGSFTQAFFGGQSPWQYEALYINPACVRDHGRYGPSTGDAKG
jgi:hypothetical protein